MTEIEWREHDAFMLKMRTEILGFRFSVERIVSRISIELATDATEMCWQIADSMGRELMLYTSARIKPRSSYWREQLGECDGAAT